MATDINTCSDPVSTVVDVKVSVTPPILTIVSIGMPLNALEECLTVTVLLTLTEPATLVHGSDSIWYSGLFVPEILMVVGWVIPVTVIVFEVITVNIGTFS